MNQTQLPPYLGSWEDMVKALLHNPTLGSGGWPAPHGTTAIRLHGFPQP